MREACYSDSCLPETSAVAKWNAIPWVGDLEEFGQVWEMVSEAPPGSYMSHLVTCPKSSAVMVNTTHHTRNWVRRLYYVLCAIHRSSYVASSQP